MMWWGGGHWGWEPWVASTLSMLIFWGLVIAAILFAVRAFSVRRGDGHEQRSSAEGILAERYARGEIDDDEFRRRREALRSMR